MGKPIWTKGLGNRFYATDRDGNQLRVSAPPEMSFLEGHQYACRQFLLKMGWTARCTGHHVLQGGQNQGMVWTDTESDLVAEVTPETLLLAEFVADCDGVVGYEADHLEQDWPDLNVTYQKAKRHIER